MSAFVPFAPAGPATGEPPPESFQLTVLPQAREAVPFVPAATPAPTTHSCPVPPTGPPSQPGGQAAGPDGPEVSYDREGDRVVRIRVRCGCGQVLELNLDYGG